MNLYSKGSSESETIFASLAPLKLSHFGWLCVLFFIRSLSCFTVKFWNLKLYNFVLSVSARRRSNSCKPKQFIIVSNARILANQITYYMTVNKWITCQRIC